jgi:hypothetical protein
VARVVEEVDPIAEQIASYAPSFQEARAPEPVPEPERRPAPSPVLYDVSPVVEDPELAPYILPPIVEAPEAAPYSPPPVVEEHDPIAAQIASYEPAADEEPRLPEPEAVEYAHPPVVEATERVAEEDSDEAASTTYDTTAETSSVWAAAEAAPPDGSRSGRRI